MASPWSAGIEPPETDANYDDLMEEAVPINTHPGDGQVGDEPPSTDKSPIAEKPGPDRPNPDNSVKATNTFPMMVGIIGAVLVIIIVVAIAVFRFRNR